MQVLPPGQKGEIDVAWEDQSKINEFSKLTNRISTLEDVLKKQHNEKEYLDDVSMELELVDEEEQVQYKIGDTFVYLPQPEVMERLEQDSGKINQKVEETEKSIQSINSRMDELRKDLYAKFGNSINLER